VSTWHNKSWALSRYITGKVGISNVTADKIKAVIHLGRTPYRMRLVTAKGHARTLESVADLRRGEPNLFIVQSFGAERVEDFIVSMTLETFAPLLEAHYKATVLPRLQEGE
jgi:hypothetical protein